MKHLVYVSILSLLLYACDDNESTAIGANFFQDAALDLSVLDTVSVTLSTIRHEKLVTNNTSRLLLGHHTDPTLGSITSSTYFRLSSPGSFTLTENNSSYNYLTLVLKYDDYFMYDTAALNTLDVYRVAEEIDVDDKGYLYNYSHFSLRPERLGSYTFKPRPHSDSIAIKLDDALGLDLYNKILARADEVTNQTDFLKYIRGLAIFPDSTQSGSLIGFTTAASLRLYYVDKSVVPANRDAYISFPLQSTGGTFFNHISADRTNTALDGLLTNDDDILPATHTNQQAYIEAGSGLALRIDFPYVKSLIGTPNFYITNATLKIYPSHGSYSDLMPLPQTLTSYVVYSDNSVYATFSDSKLSIETELPRDAYYAVDVTGFVQSLIADAGNRDNQHALLFELANGDYNTSASRLFAGTTKTALTLYFATVKNN